ncbi:MAG: conjugal transfer protein TraN [Gammaproteobacteria bacterium]|nr:conjugal transfer protein TraN [Gammaproteobacteria bacterium]
MSEFVAGAAIAEIGFESDAATAGASNVSFEVGLSYAGIGLSYSSTAVAAGVSTTTTSSLGFTTYSYGLGGGMQLTFTPVLLYVYVAILAYQMYQQALACDEKDYMTATKNKASLCYKTHTYCAKKDCGIFGCTCTKYRTAQCCYNSRLAKLINQQGKAQLGISGESDKCDGFTVEQIQNLDWSKIDLSEFVAELLTQAQKGIPTAADLQGVTNRVRPFHRLGIDYHYHRRMASSCPPNQRLSCSFYWVMK